MHVHDTNSAIFLIWKFLHIYCISEILQSHKHAYGPKTSIYSVARQDSMFCVYHNLLRVLPMAKQGGRQILAYSPISVRLHKIIKINHLNQAGD